MAKMLNKLFFIYINLKLYVVVVVWAIGRM